MYETKKSVYIDHFSYFYLSSPSPSSFISSFSYFLYVSAKTKLEIMIKQNIYNSLYIQTWVGQDYLIYNIKKKQLFFSCFSFGNENNCVSKSQRTRNEIKIDELKAYTHASEPLQERHWSFCISYLKILQSSKIYEMGFG